MTLDFEALKPYLQPAQTPEGFTSREIVRRAIEFKGPPRLPYSFFHPLESDFMEVTTAAVLVGALPPMIPWGDEVRDEWGVGWRGTGRLVLHSTTHPLSDLSTLDRYAFPDVLTSERVETIKVASNLGHAAGKYVVGADIVGNYERLRALIGFEDMLIAMHEERKRFEELLDRLTDMTLNIVEAYGATGSVDGFMTYEDWGLQNALQIRPDQFREIFKPRYARIVEAVHDAGMHYIWHCCGWIVDIIPDMIEIGVDVLQLDQPRLMGYDLLTDRFGGEICFWNLCDIQWSALPGVTASDAHDEVRRMVNAFDRFGGGLIARQYPSPRDINLTREKDRAIYEAFMESAVHSIGDALAGGR